MSNWAFLKEFARSPKEMGSIIPSSPALGQLMVDAADIGPDDVVVELGAGTGAISREILIRHPENEFLCLEPNPDLARTFRKKWPALPLVQGYAQDLPRLVEQWGHPRVDRVVSGLPLTILDKDLLDPIFSAVTQVLSSRGRMVTFSYVHSQMLPQAKLARHLMFRHFGRVRKTEVEWVNMPPALAFVCDQPLCPPRTVTEAPSWVDLPGI